MKFAVALRSCVFAVFQAIVTPVYALIALATFPLPALLRYRIIKGWAWLTVFSARWICGIRFRVIGADNIPEEPCIILSKHQSAWETLAFQQIFPPHVWVLKRELLRVPFFGWGLAMLSPIAIDRSAGTRALIQTLEQGRERLRDGFSIVIFPEGTRVAPGHRARYHSGGAWLATKTGVPVVPVAHNAGACWRRNAFLKFPGLITVSIGPPLEPHNLRPEELIGRVETWIENEMAHLEER